MIIYCFTYLMQMTYFSFSLKEKYSHDHLFTYYFAVRYLDWLYNIVLYKDGQATFSNMLSWNSLWKYKAVLCLTYWQIQLILKKPFNDFFPLLSYFIFCFYISLYSYQQLIKFVLYNHRSHYLFLFMCKENNSFFHTVYSDDNFFHQFIPDPPITPPTQLHALSCLSFKQGSELTNHILFKIRKT